MAYSKRYRQTKKATRSTITWKDNTGAKPAPFAQAKQSFQGGSAEYDYEALLPWLVPGTLWIAKEAMTPNLSVPSKFPYLERTYVWPGGQEALVMPGSAAMYAGAIHVDESRDAHGKIVRVWRHTFIVSGGRYVVVDLQRSMEPVK